jgi:hypothetical protein
LFGDEALRERLDRGGDCRPSEQFAVARLDLLQWGVIGEFGGDSRSPDPFTNSKGCQVAIESFRITRL